MLSFLHSIALYFQKRVKQVCFPLLYKDIHCYSIFIAQKGVGTQVRALGDTTTQRFRTNIK